MHTSETSMGASSTADIAPARQVPRGQIAVLLGLSLAVRLAFTWQSPIVYGDAVSYAWGARDIAAGELGAVDPFWCSLFSFWQALFHLPGWEAGTAAIASSLIPGALLVLPVSGLATSLFGPRAGLWAGIFTALHPRLVEFSANGHSESFYLLMMVSAAWATLRLMSADQRRYGLLAGLFAGLYVAVRNEGILLAATWLILLLLPREIRGAPAPLASRLRGAGWMAAALAVTLGAYVGLSQQLVPGSGLFMKRSNLAKRYSEQLDLHASAQEVYREDGLATGAAPTPPAWEVARTLIKRLPHNLLYTLRKLPTVLITPAFVLALILPFLGLRGPPRPQTLVTLSLAAFPLAFYPLIQVEPRLLFPALIPAHVYAGAAVDRLWRGGGWPRARAVAALGVVATLALSVGVAGWRARALIDKHRPHQAIASWVAAHVPAQDKLVGCGYGWASTAAFMAGRRATPRIWTDDPEELVQDMAGRRARWLLIFGSFVEEANPEIREIRSRAPRGLLQRYLWQDPSGRWAAVYELEGREEPDLLNSILADP